jgi:hypothetical protein
MVVAALSSRVNAQDKARFTFHVSQVVRDGYVLRVEGESTAVRYKLSCNTRSAENKCYMPQAAKDYQAVVAQDPGYIYMYGISEGYAIFSIDGQEEKPRGRK